MGNHQPHQHLSLRDKRVKPMPEHTLQLGVNLNTKHLQEHPNNLVVTPAATPAVLPTSPNSSRRSPTACSTSPGRHQGLRHLLLHHRLPLPPLQPPRLPHPVRPLRGARHLSPPHALAHRARRPPPLLRHLLPPSCLRPLPPPALPAQAACSSPAPGRSR